MPEGMDIFDMFFGGGRRRRGGGGKRKAEDTVYPLKVSLEDLYNGKTAKLAITRNVMKGEPRKCSDVPRARSGDPDAPDRPGHGATAPSEVSRLLGRL